MFFEKPKDGVSFDLVLTAIKMGHITNLRGMHDYTPRLLTGFPVFTNRLDIAWFQFPTLGGFRARHVVHPIENFHVVRKCRLRNIKFFSSTGLFHPYFTWLTL